MGENIDSIMDEYNKNLGHQEDTVQNAKENIDIFVKWMSDNYTSEQLYFDFAKSFPNKFLLDLYWDMCNHFMNGELVSDDAVFYWKLIIISLLKKHKYLSNELDDLVLDIDNKYCNIKLVQPKNIFRIFIKNRSICYFKENGNEYYVS
jgi:hypothetical protein